MRGAIALAAVVLLCGYAREIAIGLGVPPAAVGGTRFALDAERNVPAWASVLLLFSVAATMFVTACREFGLKLNTAWGWLILAIGFVYLGIDEQVGFHERLDRLDPSLRALGGIFYYHWWLYVLPLLLIVGVAFIPFLRRLPSDTARQLIIAGSVFLAGGMGFEMIGGAIVSMGNQPGLHVLAFCAEETLEIAGTVLALRCVLAHLSALPARSAVAAT